MTGPLSEEYIRAIVQVAERDPSIGRVIREICALEDDVRGPALDLVGAHLRTQAVASDVLDCVQALRRDEVVRAIAARLGPPG